MNIVDIIRCKRDGGELNEKQIRWFVEQVTSGSITEGQTCAWLMAVFLKGMTTQETIALTDAMLHSGTVADFSNLPGRKVDKHSTGGVGDKVSLILAPVAAACGLVVPMISGRGLGHTGGTLDKLESIPGFKVQQTLSQFEAQLRAHGLSMIGQSATMVPADKRLYALRDVTATVESVPLICASIMSKKLAEGLDALVLDIKCGRGAFMKDLAAARVLGSALVQVGNQMGKPTRALITRMDDPLGSAIGNAVEVAESLQILRGAVTSGDLLEVTLDLCVEMLLLGGVTQSATHARELCTGALQNGSALAKFRAMVEAQGGDPRVTDSLELLPQAPFIRALPWPGQDGYLHSVDSLQLAQITMSWGAGRLRQEDTIDPAVGISGLLKKGELLTKHHPVLTAHCRTEAQFHQLEKQITTIFEVQDSPPTAQSMVLERL